MLYHRRLCSLVLLSGLGLGCSLFPRADGDTAEFCETAEDCEQPEDKRYRTVCKFGEEGEAEGLDPDDADMICVSDFAPLGCNPDNFGPDHPVTLLLEEYPRTSYTSVCEGDAAGSKGCPGPPCDDGLSPNDHGACDDDDPSTPAAIPADPSEHVHQDILDQYCRWFFCDRSFVCDTDGFACKPCDPSRDYGNGGCGELYVEGELSCHYLDRDGLQSECDDRKDPDMSNPAFGDCG
jgi:hypothetical protein